MKLYDYQTKYLENLPKDVIMTADVGLGKTIMALEHYRRWNVYRDQQGEYVRSDGFAIDVAKVDLTPMAHRKIVVIAPASKVRTGDWDREIKQFFDDRVPAHKVISYEMFTKKWRDIVTPDTTLIIDECHMACNATTQRGRAIQYAVKVAHQWIMLSATPLPNGWRSGETYAIITGLSRTKTDFVNRYIIIDRSKGFPLVLGYRYENELNSWWERVSKPLARTGDLVLPSYNIAVQEPMSPRLRRVYIKAARDRLYEVDGEYEMLDNPGKVFATLRQIPTPLRVDMLQSILESTDEHIVVFYNFNSERDAIVEMLDKSFKERRVYEQSGHRSKLPLRSKWGKLRPSVTLVQYQSGSQAIELTYASVTVYFSPCTSYANYEQSKGRTRRNGQEKTTLFYHLMVQGTLDKHIWQILKEKRDFSTALIKNIIDKLNQ